jgi:LacI family transcriptional regulator
MSEQAQRAAGARRVRLIDVARHAAVDISVVSRVINNDPRLNIREGTRVRVLGAIQDLGYVPNAAARSLRTARAGALGLFLPDHANPVYAEIISGANAAATARGYALLTGTAEVTPRTFLDLLGQGRVDGLLLAGDALDPSVRDALEGHGVPYLLLNRRIAGSRRYVILDDDKAARLAVRHLINLGHTRIAHLAGPSAADTARRRRAGFAAALGEAGLPHDPSLVVSADYTPHGGAAAMSALLARADPPTAVVVANMAAAIGALSAARGHGIAVPDDVSVVAIHDSALSGYLAPPLTTVRMPLDALGRRAVELLVTQPFEAPIEEIVSGPIELVVRESTAPPRPGGPMRSGKRQAERR